MQILVLRPSGASVYGLLLAAFSALVIYDKMAEHAEKQGRIEDAASVRRDKVGLLHNLQQDSLLIEEAHRQGAEPNDDDLTMMCLRLS